MKVLFCSPYLDSPEVVKGGIQMWGKYIVSYHSRYASSDLDLIPSSFDRRTFLSNGDVSIWKRIYSGISEQTVSLKNAQRLLMTENPDVVHICTSASLGLIKDLLLLKAARNAGTKSVVHLHFGRTPELADANNWEWKLLEKVVLLADVVVVMNKPTYDTLVEKGFSNIKYLPNPLPIDIIDRIKMLSTTNISRSEDLVYVGQVLKTKGVYELVSACSEIEGVKLRIIGKYEQNVYDDLIQIASKRDEGSWITFLGLVDHDEVLKELMKAGMFVFPSYTEGFPNVILEAMACGCPIASSNVGAIPEMLDIETDPCGICFESRNKDVVKSAILKLRNDSIFANSLADKAKKRVYDLYAMPKVWNELVRIWKEA